MTGVWPLCRIWQGIDSRGMCATQSIIAFDDGLRICWLLLRSSSGKGQLQNAAGIIRRHPARPSRRAHARRFHSRPAHLAEITDGIAGRLAMSARVARKLAPIAAQITSQIAFLRKSGIL
ncbi:hypothetical protein [Caballeronia insecticola]|uniref:hypothetical protein n=1 Tax=Caballeronia insecticola TaxID=758793 RepID=UPI001360B5D9|nr:hypothetical protein [Caballeronia insecticola]